MLVEKLRVFVPVERALVSELARLAVKPPSVLDAQQRVNRLLRPVLSEAELGTVAYWAWKLYRGIVVECLAVPVETVL